MRGLVTSRPLFVAGLAFWSRARPGFGAAGLPIAPTRGPVNGDVAAFVFARSAPAAARTPLCELGIQLRVAASQQNAASSRAIAIATVPLGLPRRLPRCVQRSCRRRWAPGDLQHSRVLAGLAFLKPFADRGAA